MGKTLRICVDYTHIYVEATKATIGPVNDCNGNTITKRYQQQQLAHIWSFFKHKTPSHMERSFKDTNSMLAL